MEPVVTNPAGILRAIPLFAKLNDEQIGALAKLMVAEHHHPLSQIVHQGDLGNRFFVIAFGTVSKRRTTAGGAESVIGGLMAHPVGEPVKPNTPPNYFGEQMFSSQEPYDFHADAVTDVDVFRLHRKDFIELVKSQKQILHALEFVRTAERKRTHGYRWVGEGEAIILTLHKHWWPIVPGVVQTVAIALVAGIIGLVMQFMSASAYVPWVALGGAIATLGFLAYKIVDWYNDEYIVTNQRVAHVERNAFFQQELRDTAPIDKVQGVVIEREGLSGMFFRVGQLVIQTPGREEGNVYFEYVGNPERVRATILGQQDNNRARIAAEAREQFRATVRGELRQYLSPDLAVLQTEPKPTPKKKRRTSTLGKILSSLETPFNLELHQGDRIVWRKHWILLFGTTKKWLGLQFASLGLFALITWVGGFNTACLSVSLTIVILAIFPIVYEWLDWSNDIYAVTETQIIDSERTPFGLKEKTTIAPLDQITDIVVDIPNFIATLLDYGSLKIDTAGKTGQMTFQFIHDPREAQEEIYRRISDYKTKRAREDSSIRSASVVDAILAYHRLQEEKKREDNQAQSQNPSADTAAPNSTDGEPRVWKSDEPKPGSESTA